MVSQVNDVPTSSIVPYYMHIEHAQQVPYTDRNSGVHMQLPHNGLLLISVLGAALCMSSCCAPRDAPSVQANGKANSCKRLVCAYECTKNSGSEPVL